MTTSVFIFGTLLDTEVLELVCQQSIDKLQRKSASLLGFEPRYVIDQQFPVLVLAPKSTTYGEVVDFDDVLMERLNQYERDDFELCEVAVKLDSGADFTCLYFANVGFDKISERRWTLEEFQRMHKETFLEGLKYLPTIH